MGTKLRQSGEAEVFQKSLGYLNLSAWNSQTLAQCHRSLVTHFSKKASGLYKSEM